MEINVREDAKLVEIWLTQAESCDQVLQAKLKPLYQTYKQDNYLVAVFHSGDDDLYDLTHSLLLHNRELSAQKEVAMSL